MDSIAMKTLPKKFAKEAPVLIRRKRLASTGEVLETQDCLDSVAIGNDIFQCVLTGDEESVRSYLKSGKNPNLRNKNGNSLLHLAVDGGDADIVEMFLCDDRCQIDGINEMGQTPLMCAITLNDLDLVKRLRKAGADIEIRDKAGKTSLLIALYECHYSLAEYLIKHGSDVNATDALGHSALFIAINTLDKGCVKIASKLLKADYSLEKDKEWMKREGLDIEIKKSHGRISRVLRKVSCGTNHNENQDSLMSYFSVRQAPDGQSRLHVMTVDS